MYMYICLAQLYPGYTKWAKHCFADQASPGSVYTGSTLKEIISQMTNT